MSLPFFGFFSLHSASPPSFSSRSFQRRTCSCRIFRNRVFFWSSFRAFSISGSMNMSFKICCSMLAVEWWCSYHKALGGRGLCPLASCFLKCWFYSLMSSEEVLHRFFVLKISLNESLLHELRSMFFLTNTLLYTRYNLTHIHSLKHPVSALCCGDRWRSSFG